MNDVTFIRYINSCDRYIVISCLLSELSLTTFCQIQVTVRKTNRAWHKVVRVQTKKSFYLMSVSRVIAVICKNPWVKKRKRNFHFYINFNTFVCYDLLLDAKSLTMLPTGPAEGRRPMCFWETRYSTAIGDSNYFFVLYIAT